MFLFRLIVLCLVFSAASASDECLRPASPVSVPDGATAGVEQMRAANREVTQFVGDGTIYTECLQPLIDAAKEKAEKTEDMEEKAASDARTRELIRLHDSMIDEMEAVATAFNLSVNAFNAREL